MDVKRVRTVEEIVFDDQGVVLPRAAVYAVEAVTDNGVILYTESGDRFMIDLVTFENGFEAIV